MRASIQRSLARLHTTYLDTVYLHDVEFIADSKAPRTSGDHRVALGAEADAYGLGEGQEAVVYGDGDREVLTAIGELRRQQDAGVVRRVGISGASFRPIGAKLIMMTMMMIITQVIPCLPYYGLRFWSNTRRRTSHWTSSCRIAI